MFQQRADRIQDNTTCFPSECRIVDLFKLQNTPGKCLVETLHDRPPEPVNLGDSNDSGLTVGSKVLRYTTQQGLSVVLKEYTIRSKRQNCAGLNMLRKLGELDIATMKSFESKHLPFFPKLYDSKELVTPNGYDSTIAMESLEYNVLEYLKKTQPKDLLLEILLILYHSAICLKQLHDLEFIHRDFKFENILVCSNSRHEIETVKLCDFGNTRPCKVGQYLVYSEASCWGTSHTKKKLQEDERYDFHVDLYSFATQVAAFFQDHFSERIGDSVWRMLSNMKEVSKRISLSTIIEHIKYLGEQWANRTSDAHVLKLKETCSPSRCPIIDQNGSSNNNREDSNPPKYPEVINVDQRLFELGQFLGVKSEVEVQKMLIELEPMQIVDLYLLVKDLREFLFFSQLHTHFGSTTARNRFSTTCEKLRLLKELWKTGMTMFRTGNEVFDVLESVREIVTSILREFGTYIDYFIRLQQLVITFFTTQNYLKYIDDLSLELQRTHPIFKFIKAYPHPEIDTRVHSTIISECQKDCRIFITIAANCDVDDAELKIRIECTSTSTKRLLYTIDNLEPCRISKELKLNEYYVVFDNYPIYEEFSAFIEISNENTQVNAKVFYEVSVETAAAHDRAVN